MPNTVCQECGMPTDPGEYHPYAACLMFRACHDSATVRDSLAAVRADGMERAAEICDAENKAWLTQARGGDSSGASDFRADATWQCAEAIRAEIKEKG